MWGQPPSAVQSSGRVERTLLSAAFEFDFDLDLLLALPGRRPLRLFFAVGNRVHPHRLPLPLAHAQDTSLRLDSLQEFRIVVSLAIHALPREHRIIPGLDSMERKASALIADCLA